MILSEECKFRKVWWMVCKPILVFSLSLDQAAQQTFSQITCLENVWKNRYHRTKVILVLVSDINLYQAPREINNKKSKQAGAELCQAKHSLS